eukprot:4643569-Alexandrium_andersonii.AAC.1
MCIRDRCTSSRVRPRRATTSRSTRTAPCAAISSLVPRPDLLDRGTGGGVGSQGADRPDLPDKGQGPP